MSTTAKLSEYLLSLPHSPSEEEQQTLPLIAELQPWGDDVLVFDRPEHVIAIVKAPYARRFLACWNACKGISTESLVENGVASYEALTGTGQ
jgi:hypothetical protein